MNSSKILVTSALPYANGHIHLGHLVEYIQTDIWVRFQRLMGRRCVFVCADDTHGTAIMVRARQEGRSPEAVIADMREAHIRDFAGCDVEFDHFGSTHSPANRKLCGEVWQGLRDKGLISEREVVQLYDPQEKMFLADRFVKGRCPNCNSPDQYGDNCEKCGAAYAATDLIEPRSAISGAVPELRGELHYFVNTEQRHAFLAQWTQSGDHLQDDVSRWLQGAFLAEPLRDWDVSRPEPYFGFEIPGTGGKHFWYVWFDAPIGYIASTAEWCQANGESLDDWWRSPETEIHHFIGKDITYFHTLFWPVMLDAAGFQLPRQVHVHGFLTVNGEKMSKSRGTFIMASTYLKHLDPAYLRYYYASKLGPRLDNLDLNLDEFATKVNSDLVGKVVNLASRTARFLEGKQLAEKYPDDGGLFAQAASEGAQVAEAYQACDYNRAMRLIMAMADRANQYVESRAPWNLRKDPDRADELRDVCSVSLNLFRQLVVYLAPVLPRLAKQAGELLGQPIERFDESQTPLTGNTVGKFTHMMVRVDPAALAAMIDESKSQAPPSAATTAAPADSPRAANTETKSTTGAKTMITDSGGSLAGQSAAGQPTTGQPSTGQPADAQQYNDGPESLAAEPLASTITIDDFSKVDLRVARIIAAQDVPQAKKLLQLTLSLGGDERRNVYAGIKAAYKPEQLVGRLVIVVANLAPRQMSFGISEGMVVASGPGGAEVFLLSPDAGAAVGQRIH